MKKYLFVLIALSIGLFTTACSFRSEVSLDKSISASKQLDKTGPAKVEIDSKPLVAPDATETSKPKLPSAEEPKIAEGSGKTCNKHEECNKKDELCLTGICQSTSSIKKTLGFPDDNSFDPCPARPCPNCVSGTQKRSGMSYGYDDVNIQADVCLDCQFNDECKAGFRCVNDLCRDAATNTYCDFFNECLEGYKCENSKCLKE